MEDFVWFSIVFLMCVFYLGYLLGKTKFEKFAFASLEEPTYSFKSGDTLEEAIKKIEAVVKENAYLKKQLCKDGDLILTDGKSDSKLSKSVIKNFESLSQEQKEEFLKELKKHKEII